VLFRHGHHDLHDLFEIRLLNLWLMGCFVFSSGLFQSFRDVFNLIEEMIWI